MQNEQSITATAAALVVAFGLMPMGFARVGHETPHYVFHDKLGRGYMLEYGGGDNPYLDARVHSAPYIITVDMVESGFYPDDNDPDLAWELKVDDEAELFSIGFESDNQLLLDLWAIGVLATFLHDLREGKVA